MDHENKMFPVKVGWGWYITCLIHGVPQMLSWEIVPFVDLLSEGNVLQPWTSSLSSPVSSAPISMLFSSANLTDEDNLRNTQKPDLAV